MPFDGINLDPVIETLAGGKAIIQQYGWLQRELGSYGGPRCVAGAIQQAAIELWCFRSALIAYSDAIGIGGSFSAETNVMNWQDDPRRTVDEVLAGFDSAVEWRRRAVAALATAA